METALASTKRDYELLRIEFEKTMASNEQAAPIAKELQVCLCVPLCTPAHTHPCSRVRGGWDTIPVPVSGEAGTPSLFPCQGRLGHHPCSRARGGWDTIPVPVSGEAGTPSLFPCQGRLGHHPVPVSGEAGTPSLFPCQGRLGHHPCSRVRGGWDTIPVPVSGEAGTPSLFPCQGRLGSVGCSGCSQLTNLYGSA